MKEIFKRTGIISAKRLDRFLAQIQVSDDCWTWKGRALPKGYGLFSGGRTKWLAHRLSYTLAISDIPIGLFVLHRCDNPSCVRPDHLWLGSQADNMRDMAQKRRSTWGKRHPFNIRPELRPRGTRHGTHTKPERRATGARHGLVIHPEKRPRGVGHGCAKLTEAQVLEIRSRASENQRELAREFKITFQNVWSILHGKIWKHLLDK